MAYIPPIRGGGLAVMRRYQGPNLLVYSRSDSPPVPGIESPEEMEKPGEVVASAGPANKRELVGISKRSSLNLVRLLSSLDWAKHGQCYHVSLSYGRSGFPSSKDDLAAAKGALVRDLGRVFDCGIWRLEYQSRESQLEKSVRVAAGIKRARGQGGSHKVPHWHVLLWDAIRDPNTVESWVRDWWARFSGNKSFHGVKIRCGDAKATWYLSLHAAKSSQSPPFRVGRWWGYINRSRLLEACDVHCTGEVVERERVWVARLFRRATGARTRPDKGFTWFLPRRWQYEVAAWVRGRLDDERADRSRTPNPF